MVNKKVSGARGGVIVGTHPLVVRRSQEPNRPPELRSVLASQPSQNSPDFTTSILKVVRQCTGTTLNRGQFVIVQALYPALLHVRPCSSDYLIMLLACRALVGFYRPFWTPYPSL